MPYKIRVTIDESSPWHESILRFLWRRSQNIVQSTTQGRIDYKGVRNQYLYTLEMPNIQDTLRFYQNLTDFLRFDNDLYAAPTDAKPTYKDGAIEDLEVTFLIPMAGKTEEKEQVA